MGIMVVTERDKDRILNCILLCSVFLFIVGFARPYVSSRSETPVNSEYNVLTLQPIQFSEVKQYDEVQPVEVPKPLVDSQNSTSVPQDISATQPTAEQKLSETKSAPRNTHNYLSNTLRKTLNSVGIRTH